jgi:hypothetical protein
MSDSNLVACGEEHEMNTILKHFKKRQTESNRLILSAACRNWKADDAYKPHNRESFYKYLSDKGVLARLENA